jgi:hypothetical protein
VVTYQYDRWGKLPGIGRIHAGIVRGSEPVMLQGLPLRRQDGNTLSSFFTANNHALYGTGFSSKIIADNEKHIII